MLRGCVCVCVCDVGVVWLYLVLGHIVLDDVPALREIGTAALPSFGPMSVVATVAHLS